MGIPEQLVFPPILDACCGPRGMWFDSADKRALFIDKRRETLTQVWADRTAPVTVEPDIVADFTAMPFPDESFYVVVFDPPHVRRDELLGNVTKRYGALPNDWKHMLTRGFRECFRVLRPCGVLIFKWAESQFPIGDVLELTPEPPLFGHRSGISTHWVAFMKQQSDKPSDR
jgi:SAM-dependent methyltransferase